MSRVCAVRDPNRWTEYQLDGGADPLTLDLIMPYNLATLAGVVGISVSGGFLNGNPQPHSDRVREVRTLLNPRSPAKGVENNGVRISR